MQETEKYNELRHKRNWCIKGNQINFLKKSTNTLKVRGKRQRVNEWGRWKQLKRKLDEKESADSLKGFTSRLTELHTNRIFNIINIQI